MSAPAKPSSAACRVSAIASAVAAAPVPTIRRSSGSPAFLYSVITPLRCSSENDVASPVVPRTLRPLQPVSSRNRASLTERAASGAPASSTAVATAAMTPESFLFAIKLSADVVGREGGHVDQIGVLRGQVD